jgi:hypothetical protein
MSRPAASEASALWLDSVNRHPAFCSGVSVRDGRACMKIGHRLGEDGRRWCYQHMPDGCIKAPHPCDGLNAAGDACRSTAVEVIQFDGVEHPLCRFHVELADELHVIQTPPGYSKARKAEREQGEHAIDGGGLEEETSETVMGRIRARLAGLGSDTTEKIVEVLLDGLKATRWVVFNCAKCGARNRMNIADQSTRNATVKLAADLAAPDVKPTIGSGGAWAFDEEIDVYDPNVSTRVVAASAFPEREQWLETSRVDGTLAAKCERAADIHCRLREGRHVTEKELAEAKSTAYYVKTVSEQMAPAVGLDFSERARDDARGNGRALLR